MPFHCDETGLSHRLVKPRIQLQIKQTLLNNYVQSQLREIIAKKLSHKTDTAAAKQSLYTKPITKLKQKHGHKYNAYNYIKTNLSIRF